MKLQFKLRCCKIMALLSAVILFIACNKEQDNSQKFDKILEAFPDIDGETVSFIIGEDTLNCQKINDQYIFQGDIIIDKSQLNKSNGSKGAGLVSILTRWPEDRVYFTIRDDFSNKERLLAAIGEYHAKTHIKFVTRTDEPNYVEFIGLNYDGAYSNLGMIGGRQEIAIGTNCSTGGIVHEIGHTLGLIHEQSRSDRDDYIKIHFENIQPTKWDQFAKINGTLNLSDFDFTSIMLYGSFTGFEILAEKPSITTIDGDLYSVIWQNLSRNDVRSLNLMYNSTGSVSDIDGNVYKTVRIGDQWWMAENLKTTKYLNGDPILTGLNDTVWSNISSGAYSIYDNDNNNNNIYGKFYNWYAVTDSRHLCPKNWHVPSDDEWHNLISFVDPEGMITDVITHSWGSNSAGSKLKETGIMHWLPPNTDATNQTGFTALPSGFRGADGLFYWIGSFIRFYSSTEYENDSSKAWFIELNYLGSGIWHYYYSKNNGYPVRCVIN